MLSHLRKEIFPRGEYDKLKLNKIEPCKILRKFPINAYELELLVDIDISPIFNVVDLYLYKEAVAEALEDDKEQTKTWKQQFPTFKTFEIDKILDKKIINMTKKREYF